MAVGNLKVEDGSQVPGGIVADLGGGFLDAGLKDLVLFVLEDTPDNDDKEEKGELALGFDATKGVKTGGGSGMVERNDQARGRKIDFLCLALKNPNCLVK